MYNPLTDFVGLWRNQGGNVSKLEMPGLDFVIAALGRAGVVNIAVSATAPGANQDVTAWLQTATPSWNAEGGFYLWDVTSSAYVPATPALFFRLLERNAGASSISWWTASGGAPLNTVGADGDFSLRLDSPYGIYGPKAAGAWPSDPVPGSANVIESSALDNAFGSSEGDILFRNATEWTTLAIGLNGMILAVDGDEPEWVVFLDYFADVFSGTQGSVLYRGAAGWQVLGPGTINQVLTSNGPDSDPSWTPKSSEFTSGTSMVFRQSNAPLGWTKDTSIDNYGLRVVAGNIGTTAGAGFSSVFSQTSVGGTTISQAQMPSHGHVNNANSSVQAPIGAQQGGSFQVPLFGPATISPTGGDQPHFHTVNLALAYTDVIIATKN